MKNIINNTDNYMFAVNDFTLSGNSALCVTKREAFDDCEGNHFTDIDNDDSIVSETGTHWIGYPLINFETWENLSNEERN